MNAEQTDLKQAKMAMGTAFLQLHVQQTKPFIEFIQELVEKDRIIQVIVDQYNAPLTLLGSMEGINSENSARKGCPQRASHDVLVAGWNGRSRSNPISIEALYQGPKGSARFENAKEKRFW